MKSSSAEIFIICSSNSTSTTRKSPLRSSCRKPNSSGKHCFILRQEEYLNILKIRLYDQCVTLESEYLRMNYCSLKVMPLLDFWTWSKQEKDQICLNASKTSSSCTQLISVVFAQLERDMSATVASLLQAVSETLSAALLTDYSDKHEVDFTSAQSFNLDKMEKQRRLAEESRLDEKVEELRRAGEVDEVLDTEEQRAMQEANYDSGNNEDSLLYETDTTKLDSEGKLKDLQQEGVLDDLSRTLGIETEEKEELKLNGEYESLQKAIAKGGDHGLEEAARREEVKQQVLDEKETDQYLEEAALDAQRD